MKWEYLFVSCEWADFWRPRYVNQEELPGWLSGVSMSQYIQQLGTTGWEMIGFAPVTLVTGNTDPAGTTIQTDYNALELAFKRPLSIVRTV